MVHRPVVQDSFCLNVLLKMGLVLVPVFEITLEAWVIRSLGSGAAARRILHSQSVSNHAHAPTD